MESSRGTTDDLEHSIKLLGSEKAQRKSLLRLSTKSTMPKRISLQPNYNLEKRSDSIDDISRNIADESRSFTLGVKSPRVQGSYFNNKLLMRNDYEDFETSITMAPHELRDIMNTTEKTDLTLRELMDDSAATGIILRANEPWREANVKLFHEFLESMQVHTSLPQIFDTITDFIQTCTDTLEFMRGLQSKVESTQISDEEVNLENERNTWRLVYCLYQHRISTSNFQSQMEIDLKSNISEKDVVENLYKTEPLVTEFQLIVDWLEKNASDQADRLPMIEYFTDKTVAWENTLHQLQNRKSGITFKSSRPIVTSLDPDAPIREGRPLHDLDREDDIRLEKRMFLEVRCGRLQEAQALAVHCGQPWKAACLLGWTPHHDPNYTNPLPDTKLPIEGNPNRSLWKLCAWELSEDKRVGEYYRAIYASLCGNLQQLLTISKSWQDALWAHVKTLLDITVESEIRGAVLKSYTPMREEYWKNKMDIKDIFDALQASKYSNIREQSNKPDHIIQKYLILDEIPKLMEEIEILVDSGTCTSQFLRFLAHLTLFLRQIGKNTNDRIGHKVLAAYVQILIEMGDPNLVAFYTATLPQEEQITTYARFLENVQDYELRKRCIAAAEATNLHIEAITKLVVENIRQKNEDSSSSDVKGTITESDMEKINALDWVVFYQSQREEALWQANALIRYFLSNEKVDAARKALNKIPTDSIEVIMSEYPTMDGTIANLTMTNNLSKKASVSIREYLCYKAYLDAQEGFMEWFTHFHQGKPSSLPDLPMYATFTEKVAYDHKKAQYNAELERWKTTMQHHTKAVKQLLFNVLLFPDGGWLVDSNYNNEEHSSREEQLRENQMDNLRKLCVPKIALLLHSVMSEMNEHAECIQLADTLASEQHQLYKVFPRERLRDIFRKICESSLALMDQKKDPWGYPK
ncbi:nuclear pore complex protein Nup107 [Athalia rosae]|uniref:nuclear pore complex protein Nup107 n=1 Tax=Athalia rosae TaxID=37344 RepID=UPI0020332126|nr:nuclear pore complex protein Nup107 [Athalia rosae]